MISYEELMRIDSFSERLEALILKDWTYESPRDLMSSFYHSSDWRYARRAVIKRDLGQDLNVNGVYINGYIYVHHIEPITYSDILYRRPKILDPNYLITVSLDTHNIIHYGYNDCVTERKKGDTIEWPTISITKNFIEK